MSRAWSDEEEAAAVLAQVVDLGARSTAREAELGEAVARHVSARSAAMTRPEPDPAVLEGLRAIARGERCPFCGRGDEP